MSRHVTRFAPIKHHHVLGVKHPAGAREHSNSGTVWLFMFVAALVIILWRIYGRKARAVRLQQLNLEQQQREKEQAEAARAQQEAAEAAAFEAARRNWEAAEKAANAPCVTSLILHDKEVVGYATEVRRIVTHKVGHKSDRVSSRTGTSTGQTQHQGSSGSNSSGFGMWGIRSGSSQGTSSGVGQHFTQRSSSGTGHTYSQDDIKTEVVDRGQLILTNQRVVFQGDNATIEIPIEKVIGFHFKDTNELVIDYAKRLNGECYVVSDPLAMRMAVSNRLHEPGFEVPPKPDILQKRLPGASDA